MIHNFADHPEVTDLLIPNMELIVNLKISSGLADTFVLQRRAILLRPCSCRMLVAEADGFTEIMLISFIEDSFPAKFLLRQLVKKDKPL